MPKKRSREVQVVVDGADFPWEQVRMLEMSLYVSFISMKIIGPRPSVSSMLAPFTAVSGSRSF